MDRMQQFMSGFYARLYVCIRSIRDRLGLSAKDSDYFWDSVEIHIHTVVAKRKIIRIYTVYVLWTICWVYLKKIGLGSFLKSFFSQECISIRFMLRRRKSLIGCNRKSKK